MTLPAAEPLSIPHEIEQSPERFDTISITLHWATVALIIGLFASAWSIGFASGGEAAQQLLTLHRSLGVVMGLLAVTRLVWRIGFASRPAFPPDMPIMQRRAAIAVEAALYMILLVQPLTGLGQSFARGKPFQLLVFTAPKLMERDKGLTGLLHSIHELTASALLLLLALHIGAALFHGLVKRDGVLAAMWPRTSRSRR